MSTDQGLIARTAGMRILLVDHSRVAQKIWGERLRELGHSVGIVGSAEDALAWLEENRVDLMLIAYTLPGMDGVDLTRAVRRLPAYQGSPIILLTGRSDLNLQERAYAAGVSDLADKTNIRQLSERLERILADNASVLSGRIAYVEDSPTIAHVMIETISRMQLAVDHFTEVDEALEAIKRRPYDLVITDVTLDGDRSGVELVEAIRSLPDDRAQLPILAVSGMEAAERRRALFRRGITDYLRKPALPEEVTARVTSLLASRQLLLQVRAQTVKLYRSSMQDPLTGLLTRLAFRRFSEKFINQVRRHKTRLSFAVVTIDDLETINGRHGYEVGDEVLKSVAKLIESTSRGDDLVARIGGASYGLMLNFCGIDDATERIGRLQEEVANFVIPGRPVKLSCGVSANACLDDAHDYDVLLRAAELARSEARRSGGNRVVVQQVRFGVSNASLPSDKRQKSHRPAE